MADLPLLSGDDSVLNSIALDYTFFLAHQSVIDTRQLFAGSFPIEFLSNALTTCLCELCAVVRISLKPQQGRRQIGYCLLGVNCLNLDAGGIGDAHGRTAEIETDHWPSRSHGFEGHPASGIMETG